MSGFTSINRLGRTAEDPRQDEGRQQVSIACEVRKRNKTETMLAVWQGAYEDKADATTGEILAREKWIWLPLSQITVNGDGTVSMPLWLAKRKGLM